MKVKEYTLDVSVWRCGGYGPHAMGEGRVLMLNEEGYMCCLGQFALQSGVDETKLLGQHSPSSVSHSLDEPYDHLFVCTNEIYGWTDDTPLSSQLMKVNDDEKTTPSEKVSHLRRILSKHNIKLNVVDTSNVLKGGTCEN